MESYPGGTYKRISDPEELSDRDIRDTKSLIKEKEKPEGGCPNTSGEEPCGKTETEQRTARGAEERTESSKANAGENANDGRSDPKTEGGLEKGQKTPTETPRRPEQRRHITGGAWLTQSESKIGMQRQTHRQIKQQIDFFVPFYTSSDKEALFTQTGSS
ncbi:hypothetical protein NDU88_002880 [Pleurodeles waltl]|uniref:Uncharacterized protein n=1 Tax=Pleurodeles waltl TaxID=8319 RepID=A0AAV7QA57_PLEWA|nr:hypothetical protein NDU88_002880 [Pleurodeles waltl]